MTDETTTTAATAPADTSTAASATAPAPTASVASAAISAGALVTADSVTAKAKDLMANIDAAELHTRATSFLQNARLSVAAAIQFIEQHWAALEADVKADIEKLEDKSEPAPSTTAAAPVTSAR